MSPLPVPWWAFWLTASLILYSGLIWLFVREATTFGQEPPHDREQEDAAAPSGHDQPSSTSAAGADTQEADAGTGAATEAKTRKSGGVSTG